MADNYEKVSHPDHYNWHPKKIECIDVIEEFPFNTGNAIKYIWRSGRKPGENSLEDLRKAKFYIQREIDRLQYPAEECAADPPVCDYCGRIHGV